MPIGREVRVKGQPVRIPPRPAKAERRRLPKSSECGHVDAAGCVAHVVIQVDPARLPEELLRHFHVAQAGRYQRVSGRAKRAAMSGPWLVVAEVDIPHPRRKSVPLQI